MATTCSLTLQEQGQTYCIQDSIGAGATGQVIPTVAQAGTATTQQQTKTVSTTITSTSCNPQVTFKKQYKLIKVLTTDVSDLKVHKYSCTTKVATSVANLTAAQGTAILMTNPVQREIQAGELISSTANAEKAKAFTEQIEAATSTASDKATVAGQLAH